MEEVVIGHIWDAAARLFHDFHGFGIDFSRFLQREELLHFLQCVLEHHEVASVLWASIKLIQIVLKEKHQPWTKATAITQPINHPPNQPINHSNNQPFGVYATCWLIVGKKGIFWKCCVNLPEQLLCLFLVYRLQETWLWGTVQRRSPEKRRSALKTLLEQSADSWTWWTSPSLCLLTMRQRRWKRLRFVVASARLFLFSWTGHPAPRLRLYELSQFCWHTHFSPRESDVRNRLTEKYEQDENKRNSIVTRKFDGFFFSKKNKKKPSSFSFF